MNTDMLFLLINAPNTEIDKSITERLIPLQSMTYIDQKPIMQKIMHDVVAYSLASDFGVLALEAYYLTLEMSETIH